MLRLWYVSLYRVQRLREAIEEHREIIALIEIGDSEGAARIMRAHIAEFQAQFMSIR
jgi:DNA-binding GntR family transcriptional regulator